MLTLDGITWPWPCDIVRTSTMQSSDISGMLMDNTFFNDVLGQYLSYEISVAPPISGMDQYRAFYAAITDPVDGHTVTLPYGDSEVTIDGRIENIRDEYVRMPNGKVYWKGIKFTVTANQPTRSYSLGDALERGRTLQPEIAEPLEGDEYVYHNGEWIWADSIVDADVIEY